MADDSVGKIKLDLETNDGPFNQQLNNISGKATKSVMSAFGKMGKVIAGAFAVKKLIEFGKASIDLASDLSEVQNVVDVVFGKSAETINNFAKTALTQYGLSELSAKKYASTMGAMLKSMGLSQKATVDMSQAITALSGDMASFYNLDGDEAFNKIRAGISGETEPLKQLGINMSVANMEAFALSQGITKSYQSMTQAEQALLRYNYLLNTTKDAQGDFARTSDGWANQTRILTEQFNTLKATLGSAFIAVLAPVVKMLNWLIGKLQIAAAYFKAFVEAITGVKADTNDTSAGLTDIADSATEAGDATEKAAKKASKALAGFDKLNVLSSGGDSSDSGGGGGGIANLSVPEFSTVMPTSIPEPDMSGAEKVINKVKSLFSSLKSYVTTAFAPSIKSWGKAFTDLQMPVKNAFTSIAGTAKGFWDNTLKPFSGYLLEDFVPSIVNTFSEVFAPIFTDVMSFALEQFASNFDFVCQQVSNLVNDIWMPAMETVKTITTDAATAVGDEWDKSGQRLLDLFGGVIDSFKKIWNTLYYEIIKPVWDSIIEAIDSLWEKHLKGLWESIVSFVSKLAECIMTLWNNFLAPIVNWLIEVLGPIITNLIRGLLGYVQTIVGVIADVCKGIFKALGGLLDFITGVFSGNWKKAWEGIKNFFKGIWDAIWGICKGVVNLIIDGINLLWSGIYGAISGLINGIGSIAGAIGDLFGKDWKFSMPKKAPLIPKLARGGIIDQPTLAMVGEKGKEAVVPLENTAFADSIARAIFNAIAPLFSGNNSTKNTDDNTPQVIVLKIGEYELGRISVGAINKYHNIVGKVELEV